MNHRDGIAMFVDPDDLASTDLGRVAAVDELAASGFLADVAPAHRVVPPTTSAARGLVWRGADRFVTRLHGAGLHRAFDPRWVAMQAALAVGGAVATARTFAAGSVEVHADAAHVPAVILLGLVAVVVHELGHALATTHFGRRISVGGLRLHLGAPALYVESLDALLLPRRQRLVQAAAGPWAEWLFTSSVALGFVLLDPTGAVGVMIQRFVVLNTIVIASNLLPFAGLDGALLLADLVRRPDLPLRARRALRRGAQAEPWVALYAAVNALVTTGLLAMAGFFWWQVFGGLVAMLWATSSAAAATMAVLAVMWCDRRLAARTGVLVRSRDHFARLWSKAVFRSERRWRVAAIHGFRRLPELAPLEPSDLGVIAGHLRRCRARDVATASACALYVKAERRSWRLARCPDRTASVVAPSDIATLGLEPDREVVVLPASWRESVAATRHT